MNQSNEIGLLVKAMTKVQGSLKGALKDAENPFFHSNYADLESVWGACREQLVANDLVVVQTMANDERGDYLITTLLHVSGQWIRSNLRLCPVKPDPQAMGSAITYARRYALAAIVGIVQTDDDAEAAMNRGEKTTTKARKAPGPVDAKPPVAPITVIAPTASKEPVKVGDATKPATDGQRKLVWARLKNELALDDTIAKDFIFQVTGKESGKDLTMRDVNLMLAAIDKEVKAQEEAGRG